MLGKMLKLLRTDSGLSQKELAEKLNIAQTTLSGYETNYSNPTYEMIEKIAQNCGYEIIFRNINTNDEYSIKQISRKDTLK